jgi:hypothetical protein
MNDPPQHYEYPVAHAGHISFSVGQTRQAGQAANTHHHQVPSPLYSPSPSFHCTIEPERLGTALVSKSYTSGMEGCCQRKWKERGQGRGSEVD